MLFTAVAPRIMSCEHQVDHFMHKHMRLPSDDMHEGVSKSFRTGRLESERKWYSSLPLGAVVALFYGSV